MARSLIGLSLNGVRRCVAANCTIYAADAAGISISNATDTAVFNNVVAQAGTAIVVGGTNERLAADCNLYVALSVGKLADQLQRPTIPTWRDVSGGLDARSVQLDVAFAAAARNDFRPVSTLSWDPLHVTTADWGVPELGGHKAPATDIDGQPRVGGYDLGAYEAPVLPSRPADGTFQVAADEGVKSAGLFRPDGTLVRYLFQGLPLKKGTYAFVVPERDLFGRAIPAGTYELRLAEANVGWQYRTHASNAGADNRPENADSVHVGSVAFLPDGALLAASGWSERHINLRRGDVPHG